MRTMISFGARRFYELKRASVIMCLVSLSLLGCTSFDPLDNRAENFNLSATDYSNNAILLNVIRASLLEPLTFVTITSVDGTGSASGNLGLPTISFGPHLSTSPRAFSFGPNSATRSNSNTFHVSVVNDPASFTALLAPVN